MKRILASILLALPIAITSLPSQVSAAEIIVRPNGHSQRTVIIGQRGDRQIGQRGDRYRVIRNRNVRQRWIPGHWERTRRGGRQWVRGRYVRY